MMITLKRTAIAIGMLFAVTWGAAALEVPRSPAENESVPQPPMLKAQTARLPEKAQVEVRFHASQPPPLTMFQGLDLNGDGLLSPFEVNDELSADFTVWDSNGDGKVSESEYARYRSDRGTLARNRSKSSTSDRY
jgi:hypothetical protein